MFSFRSVWVLSPRLLLLLLMLLLFLVCWQFMWQESLFGIELRLRDIVEFSGHRAQIMNCPRLWALFGGLIWRMHRCV